MQLSVDWRARRKSGEDSWQKILLDRFYINNLSSIINTIETNYNRKVLVWITGTQIIFYFIEWNEKKNGMLKNAQVTIV